MGMQLADLRRCRNLLAYWEQTADYRLAGSPHSRLCRAEEKQPVMNDGSTVNEKSTGKHKALNARAILAADGSK